jgi:alpha-glucosidase
MNKSVSLQQKSLESVLNFYKEFIAYRKINKDLSKGDQIFIHEKDNILIFKRNFKNSRTSCVFNLNNKRCIYKNIFKDMDIKISNNAEIEKNQIILNNYGFMILEDKKD